MVVFYGFLHQGFSRFYFILPGQALILVKLGGVVPSLAYAQQQSTQFPPTFAGVPVDVEADLIYYKTYMPPRYLLAQPKASSWPIQLHDTGSHTDRLIEDIDKLMQQGNSTVFLVKPSTVQLPPELVSGKYEYEVKKSFWPHFSSEDPPFISEILSSTLDILYVIKLS